MNILCFYFLLIILFDYIKRHPDAAQYTAPFSLKI